MKIKEKLHINRVIRILDIAVKKLEKLTEDARENDTFPKTTQKAFVESMTVLNNTKVRVAARDASVV